MEANKSKPKGASILFVNNSDQVLLFLRDNITSIPYPNMWDIPGGHVEDSETPEHCIVREMKEEMGLDLNTEELKQFSITPFDDRDEYTYWQKANFDISKMRLSEGQCLKWFSLDEVRNTKLAYEYNQIIEKFYQREPFGKGN